MHFNLFDPSQYNKSFDYIKNRSGWDDLNFVYLVDQESYSIFKRRAKIDDHHMELESRAAISDENNSRYLDK